MYQLKTEADFDSAHFLSGYTGKCSNIHGHRWHVEIEIESRNLEKNGQERGMLVDATYGRKTKSVLLMDSDHVILAAITPETVAERMGIAVERYEEEGERE